MRQGQQNRRGRGRNRKNQNPLSRNFESNGPDVKIRGSAAHIAEKYMSLARDAMAAGDPIIAENYLQHAEHYNRIIMAAQAQMQQPFDPMSGGARPRSPEEAGQDQDGDYDDDDAIPGRDGFQPHQGMRDQQQHGGHRDDRRHRFDRRHEGGQRPVPGMDDQPDIRASQGVQPASGEAPAVEGERPPRTQNTEGGFRRDRQDDGNFRGNRRRGRHHNNGNGMNGERRGEGEARERLTPPKDEEPVQG